MQAKTYDAQDTKAGCTHIFQVRRGAGVTHAMVQYLCETRHRYNTGAVMRIDTAFPDYLRQPLFKLFPGITFKEWPSPMTVEAAEELCEEQSQQNSSFVMLNDGFLTRREVQQLVRTNRHKWGLTLLINLYNTDLTIGVGDYTYVFVRTIRFQCEVTEAGSPQRSVWKTNKNVMLREDAATTIQKCARGWLLRKTQLWNVHTNLGQRYLRQQAKLFTSVHI